MASKFNFSLLISLLFILTSCSDKDSVQKILSDPQKQDEVLSTIAKDSTLLMKLCSKMQGNNQSMTMNGMNMGGDSTMMNSCMSMMDNPKMMNRMMDHMMMQCEKDSAMCRMMHNRMMSSPAMKNMMDNDMMNHKGMDMSK